MLCVCASQAFFSLKLFSLYYYYNIPLSPFRAVVSINQSTISVEQQQHKQKKTICVERHTTTVLDYTMMMMMMMSLSLLARLPFKWKAKKGCSPTPKNNNKK